MRVVFEFNHIRILSDSEQDDSHLITWARKGCPTLVFMSDRHSPSFGFFDADITTMFEEVSQIIPNARVV